MKIKRHDTRSEREKNLRDPAPVGLHDQIVQGVTERLATMTYTPDNLLRHIAIKLNQIEPILKRDKTRFGRFINRFNGESPKYITIDGMVLIQLHEVLSEKPPFPIEAKNQYDIDHNDLRDLYTRAREIVPSPSVKRRR